MEINMKGINMTRFNTQLAEIAADHDLCKKVSQGVALGQSIRHIANKFQLSDYAVRKIAKHWADSHIK